MLIALGVLSVLWLIIVGVDALRKHGLARHVSLKQSANVGATLLALAVFGGIALVAMVGLYGYYTAMNSTETLANVTAKYPWGVGWGALCIAMIPMCFGIWIIWKTWFPYTDEEKAYIKEHRSPWQIKVREWLKKYGIKLGGE